MTPETHAKRTLVQEFITRKLTPFVAVQGVVVIGSVGAGTAHADSDLDIVIFLDPFDLYIVPAEALWHPATDTWHSIFTRDEVIQSEGLPIDCLRLDDRQWRDPAFVWPEARRAELGSGWLAYDRTGRTEALIADRTTYNDATRLKRLDEAITWLDQHLGEDGPAQRWATLSVAEAFDRLHAAYSYLVQALFAYNRRWQTWRNREMTALLALEWLPPDFAARVLTMLNAPSLDAAGYTAQAVALQTAFADLLARVQADGLYGDDAIGEAFIRGAEEPGRAWNMREWHEGQTNALR